METSGSKLSVQSRWPNFRLTAIIGINRLKYKVIHSGIINMFLLTKSIFLKLAFETQTFHL